MRVLITASYYWPERVGMAPYVTGLAEGLSRRGDRVVVLTGYPHYPAWEAPPGMRLAATEWESGVEVRRRWHHVPPSQSALQRALYEVSLFAGGLTGLRLKETPDVIVGFMPSLAAGQLARAAGTIHRRPYAVVIHDLMGPGAQQAAGASEVVSKLVARAEVAVAKNAAAVATIADGFRPYYEQGGVAPDRIHKVRVWTRRTAPTETRQEARARMGWREADFVCLHAGNMGQKQALDTVIHAAAELGDGMHIALLGDGNARAHLETLAREQNATNVSFSGIQPPGRFEAVMEAADVLLIHQRASVTNMSLPSKLTSYFAAGRPVLAAVASNSESAREIHGSGGGILVEPENATALAAGIRTFKEMSDQGRSLGESGRQYAESYLSEPAALAEYERIVDFLATNGVR